MKRKFVILLLFFVCFLLAGCSESSSENVNESNNVSTENEMVAEQDDLKVDISKIEQIYIDEYNSQNGDSNCVRKIIEKLGDNGYIAIDSDNRVDMTNPDSVKGFIKSKESGEHDNICVLQINYLAGINVLELITDEGKVSVIQTYYSFQDGEFTETVSVEFEAAYFEYTNEGYLMIEGISHSAESYVLTLSEEEKHIALRVEHLDEECRELCAKYIEPVSYSLNNMFITSWNKDDYSNLDFYDIFDRFYKETYGTDCPYIMNDDLSIGNEYDISADEFENVIMRHFEVSSEELHQRCRYDATKNVYVYRPRGFEEFDYAEVPYPEVVDFETILRQTMMGA